MKKRIWKGVAHGERTSDGAGVQLKRMVGTSELSFLDPFLLLDEFRNEHPDDYIAGFPTHPHRGFETVTYLVQGRMRHRDSKGHEGLLTSGAVQWMTAGRGVLHSEMPEMEEGLLWGYQLWVNLPAKEKMQEPAYQEISPDRIPRIQIPGGEIRVIAGHHGGVEGPAKTHIPITYLDITLGAGESVVLQEELEENGFIMVMEGSLRLDGDRQNDSPAKSELSPADEELRAGELGVLGGGGELRVIALGGDPQGDGRGKSARFLYISGKPIGEPVARGGPFVMNTRQEILQAFRDYEAGLLA